MKNIIDTILLVIMKHLSACQKKKTNVHVLAKQIMPGCSSSQALSEDIYKSQDRGFYKQK